MKFVQIYYNNEKIKYKHYFPYKNKALGLTAGLLAFSSVLGSASIANAATFNFSFTNQDGNVNGTVSGIITLPDGDGTKQATSVVVTSAPATGLGITLPFDIFANLTNIGFNSFNVVGGMIVQASSVFSASSASSFFQLGSNGATAFSTNLGGNPITTVQDSDSSTLTYSVSTPEPTSVITLIGVGVLGVASKLKKKA